MALLIILDCICSVIETLARTGARPLLIEWDTDIPDWATLRAETVRAQEALTRVLA